MEDDSYVWCKANSQYMEASAYLVWCESIWRLEGANESIHIKKITELMNDLHDDLWSDLYDLRVKLDEQINTKD